jgi:sporulation protein YlmC with PRC-barrel domain
MQRNVYSILGFSLHASDGEIGKVREFYFDDQSWMIRYLIVETGNWLSYRKVLISPAALVKTSREDGSFPVNLTKDQIRNCPDIDTDKPVSRQQEVELFGYYPWQPYWDSGFYAGGPVDTPGSGHVIDQTMAREVKKEGKRRDDDLHLRSTHSITGYHIHGSDGEIGRLSDFVFDDQSWKLIYIVVTTKNWVGNHRVIIPVEVVTEIRYLDSEIRLNISMEKVKHSRVLNPAEFTNPEPRFENESLG